MLCGERQRFATAHKPAPFVRWFFLFRFGCLAVKRHWGYRRRGAENTFNGFDPRRDTENTFDPRRVRRDAKNRRGTEASCLCCILNGIFRMLTIPSSVTDTEFVGRELWHTLHKGRHKERKDASETIRVLSGEHGGPLRILLGRENTFFVRGGRRRGAENTLNPFDPD